MKKTNIIYINLMLIYILSQSVMSSSTKRHHEETDDLSYETALKKQKTDYLSVENLLNKLSTKLFLDRHDYQFIEEKDIKEFDTASVNKNIWHSFILMGYYFKKFNQIPSTTLKEVKKTHTQNNVDFHANFNVGLLYYFGQGVEQNYTKAFECYEKAADQGHAVAQFNLGLMYLDGRGVNQSSIEGVKCYQKAANQGYANAQFNLGLVYQDGRGVNQSSIEAFKWYQRAANQGHVDAQFNLGLMCQNGQGVEQNDTKAFEWHQKAANQGHAVAQFNLGLMYQNGQGVEQNDIKAFEKYQRAADQGHALAQNNLGLMYADGRGIEQSDTKAFEWYQKAADQGYAVAQNNLGLMYANGRGKDQNYVKALELFKKSAIRKYNSATKNFKSFFNVKFFVANFKEDNSFKNYSKTLINDIELMMSLHKKEKEVNNPKAFFKEKLPGINNLYDLYKEIVDFEQNSLEVMHVFDNPEFMITCLQPIHEGLIEELTRDAKQYMSLCMINELEYVNFGFKNVELANKFISLLNDQNSNWIKANQTLIKVNTKLYQTYLKKAIKAQNAMKEVQDLTKFDLFSKNLEKKSVLEEKLRKFNTLIDDIKIKLKHFRKLNKIPNKIKNLFVQTIAYRNQLFLMQNSFLQER